jgi:uncharacterized protein (UPF0332 family)
MCGFIAYNRPEESSKLLLPMAEALPVTKRETYSMPPILPRDRLLRVSSSKSDAIKAWKEGVSLSQDSARTLPDLLRIVAVDRLRLGLEHRRQANRLMSLTRPLYRSAVSRYYYAMYHSMRACAYICHGGDDYEKHALLPEHIPPNFDPDPTVNWQNRLKDARTVRNSADYDPYPKADSAWKKKAIALKKETDVLLALAQTYLRSKGCIL